MKRKKVHAILIAGVLICSQALSVEAAVPKKELARTAAESDVDVEVEEVQGEAKEEAKEEVKVKPMYRLFNKATMEHFYTDSEHERDVLKTRGWIDEGVGWYAPEKSSTPVYRLYNVSLMDHHYTTSVYERDVLVKQYGWISEGIGWYSDDGKGVPLYRRYCPLLVSGAHHYTPSRQEADYLASVGWQDEGIAWYGVDPDRSQEEPATTETPESSAVTPEPSAETPEPSTVTPEPSAVTPEPSTETPESSKDPSVSPNPTATIRPRYTYDRGRNLAKSSPADYAQMVIETHKDFLNPVWTAGSISYTNGKSISSATAIRTSYQKLKGKVIVLNSAPDKYKVRVCRYRVDADGKMSFDRFSDLQIATAAIKPENDCWYRFSIIPLGTDDTWSEADAKKTVKMAYVDSFTNPLQVPQDGVKSLAHMGYYTNDTFHVNTLEAFRWAWILGYDGSEMDVNVSRDGVPFICHDTKLEGTDKKEYALTKMDWADIRNTTFWNDGTVIPSLDEALEQAEECGYMVLLDLKDSVSTEQAVEIARRVAISEKLKNHVIFASTNLSHLVAIRKEDPNSPVMIQLQEPLDLVSFRTGTTSDTKTIKKLLASTGETLIALRPNKNADETYYEALKEMGFTLIMTDTSRSGDLAHFIKYCDYYCSPKAGTVAYGLEVERNRKGETELTPGFSYNRGDDVRDAAGANIAKMIEEKHKDFLNPDWNEGSISFETGRKTASATAMRTANLVLEKAAVVVNSSPDKYKVRVCRYRVNKEGKASYDGFIDYDTATVSICPGDNGYYRIAVLPISADVTWNLEEAKKAVKLAYVDSFTEPLQKPLDGMKSLAHMGYYANDTFHMNTLEAYRWAWILGYDGSEMDVCVSKDGVPFMSHSEQKTDVNKEVHNLSEMTWEEIQNTEFWKDGTKIPSLDEALAQAEDCGYTAFVDLKNTVSSENATAIAQKVMASDYLKDHVILASDDINTIKAIREVSKDIPVLFQSISPIALKNLREGSGKYETLRQLAKETPMLLAVNPEKKSDDAYFEGLKDLGFDIILTETTMKGDVAHFRKYCDYFCSFNTGTVKDILSY